MSNGDNTSSAWASQLAFRECNGQPLSKDEAQAALYNSWFFCESCQMLHEQPYAVRLLLVNELAVAFPDECNPEVANRWIYRPEGVPFDDVE